MAATASDAAASPAGLVHASDGSTPSSAAKNRGSMPNSPGGPNTPGFPPVALYQPNSRPLSYAAAEPSSATFPTSPASPSALPAFPPTPGLPPNMDSKDQENGQAAGGQQNRMQDQQQQAPQQHDFSNDGHSHPAGEPVWSPAHPCFPHPNPHVPLTSSLYDATRVIRIPRDWMAAGDLYPAFSTTYPEILIPWISEASFRALVNEVNAALKAAFEPATGKAVLDGLLGLLSGWLLEDVGLVGPKKRVKEVESIVDRWNADRMKMLGGGGMGNEYMDAEGEELVMVVPLRRTAYMSLDIQIPDPKIRVVGDGEADGEGEEDQTTASERAPRRQSGDNGDDGGGGEDVEKAAHVAVGGE